MRQARWAVKKRGGGRDQQGGNTLEVWKGTRMGGRVRGVLKCTVVTKRASGEPL